MVLKILNVKLESSNSSENIAPPSPPGLPILGHIPFMGKHQYLTFNNLAKKYGDVFQFRLGAIPLVVLNGVDTIKQALIKQHDDFSGRGKFFLLQNAAGGLTMGAAEYGLLWKRHREIAYNSMHMFIGNKQASIEQMVLEEATELVNILLSYAGQPIDPGVDIGVAVENVIFRILFGERNSRDDQDYEILVKTVGEFVTNFPGALTIDVIPQFRFISRIFDRQRLEKLHLFLEAMHRLLLKRIEQHEASYNPENIRDMTDALLKAVSELDETEKQTIGLTKKRVVRATVQEMMGTALEPNFSVVRWALLYMIAYPQVQAEIHQEMDKVLDQKRQVCLEDRKKLPFTEACIREILRHAPYFPMTLPHATTTDTTINGYFIPKDTTVLVNLYSMGRDKRYWEDPDKFNPRRFLTENGELRDDFMDKYYPFGLGRRRCFGEFLGRLEIFIFFANLMHKCRFERVPREKLSFDGRPGIAIPPNPYRVIIRPRRF